MEYIWDLFISHASDDKHFVRPLAEALRAKNLVVWFDEFELKPGMGLRESIDHGLSSSRFGLVILSPAFFKKKWTSWELDGLLQVADLQKGRTIIPIWHGVGHSEVKEFSLLLANIFAIDSQSDPNLTATRVFDVLKPYSVGASTHDGDTLHNPAVVIPEIDIRVLRETAKKQTSLEIQSSIGRKYVRNLYVQREQEAILNRYLCSDEELHSTILKTREHVNWSLIKCIEDIASEIANATGPGKNPGKLPELRREISSRQKRLDKAFDELLASPGGLVARRTDFLQLASQIDDISAMHEDITRAIIDDSRRLRWFALPALVIIDRAGGGKTNLLCKMAENRGINDCTLFISGRTSVETATSLLNLVATRLGWNQQGESIEFLKFVDKSLCRAQESLIVIIDGINENRRTSRLSEALQALVSFASGCSRFRILITCRDIYWRFFSGAQWALKMATIEQGGLYEFTDAERALATQRYLEFFRIEVEFGPMAYKRCKHPLLLRFFCEAYGNPTGPLHRFRDKVDEIRLKPLFDDYWKNKVVGEIGSAPQTRHTAEHCLAVLAESMFGAATSAIPTEEFAAIASITDLETRKSPYVQLLDEDILIDELPLNSNEGSQRRVVFVYEEFMEYVIARGLFQKIEDASDAAVLDTVRLFKTKLSQGFVNSLGTAEYLCAFLLDEGMNQTTMNLLAALGEVSRHDGATQQGWDNVIANVFAKYESSLVMLSECCTKLPNKISPILVALANSSRPLLINACATVIFTIILPREVTPRNIASRDATTSSPSPRYSETLLTSDYRQYSKILRTVFRVIAQSGVNASRNGYWNQLQKKKVFYGPITRAELLKLLASTLPNTPYSTILQICLCNGLYDTERDVRLAAAGVTSGLRHAAVQELRTLARSSEKDMEVMSLLRSELKR